MTLHAFADDTQLYLQCSRDDIKVYIIWPAKLDDIAYNLLYVLNPNVASRKWPLDVFQFQPIQVE